MQLKRPKSIRKQLAIATSSLLVATPLQSMEMMKNTADKTSDNINVELSRLYYSEEDRVTVNKTQALITKELSEDNTVKLNVTYDTMSGSSPNGRVYNPSPAGASNSVAVTTASGFSFNATANTSAASMSPWLTPFSDNRIAANVEWEHRFARTLTGVVGTGVSFENDYDSYNSSGKFIWDINQRRTTLTAGMGYNNDFVDPLSGVPKEGLAPLSCNAGAGATIQFLDWLRQCDATNLEFTDKPANKVTLDTFFGVTQVWNKYTLLQLNYSRATEDGYLTDPYKQVSVVNPVTNEELAILYEKRPDSRQMQSIFFKVVTVPMDKTTIHMSHRFYWDSWDIQAQTADFRLRFDFSAKSYLQPHLRVSYQTSASFSNRFIADEQDSKFIEKPKYFSADHRLSNQETVTFGIKYGRTLGKTGKFGVRVEQMRQKYKNNLLPDMKAWIVQFLLSTRF